MPPEKKPRAKRSPPGSSDHKATVNEYFRLVAQGRFEEGLRFFAPDCRAHNPYVRGDMRALTAAMAAANEEGASTYPEPAFTVEHVLADGDLVAAHTQLLGSRTRPGDGGLRQVHLFRFEGGRIVEYWDITQMVQRDMPNAAGAF